MNRSVARSVDLVIIPSGLAGFTKCSMQPDTALSLISIGNRVGGAEKEYKAIMNATRSGQYVNWQKSRASVPAKALHDHMRLELCA